MHLFSRCGPGTWLLDLANTYEYSYFFGIDIKPVYPNEIKPGNLEFREADLFNGLPFSDNEFDFVHQESMSLIIETDQWSYVISELIRMTKPGGFIEFVEYISPDKNGPIIDKI
ncbi:S-adenosyl-L-methionine-dependent methyltransferase [Glomus cerebriforme]|uniref:S-adenosyl-L-methionine-dependent methyltransferase n=1 Tax=Glomus cerebriforme TaxID=658196 RepID=A0A397TP49_9GLOM|nr:S-adenosyl-L-methionine-dependent methyltransferase [Glomus cerebriforme]